MSLAICEEAKYVRDEERKDWSEKILIVGAVFLVMGGLVFMNLSSLTQTQTGR